MIDDERRGRAEALELPAPEGLGVGGALPAEPADVLAVGARAIEPELLALGVGLVEREDLLHEQRRRPAVEEDVVAAPDEAVGVVGEPEQRDPEQRRLGEIEAADAILFVERGDARRLLLGREPAEIDLGQGQLHLPAHDLDGALEALPGEAGAEDGVARDDLFPGADERRDVELPRSVQPIWTKYMPGPSA